MNLSYNSPWYTTNEPSAQLSKMISDYAPGDLNNVFFILVHDIKKNLLTTIKSRCIQFKFFLNNDDREKRINEILNNQFNDLSSDFKNKYISPLFFKSLLEYCNKNNLSMVLLYYK